VTNDERIARLEAMSTRGLSELQRRILRLALVADRDQYGDVKILYQAEILGALYGFPSNRSLPAGSPRPAQRAAVA
jgi:hypothetical protein